MFLKIKFPCSSQRRESIIKVTKVSNQISLYTNVMNIPKTIVKTLEVNNLSKTSLMEIISIEMLEMNERNPYLLQHVF